MRFERTTYRVYFYISWLFMALDKLLLYNIIARFFMYRFLYLSKTLVLNSVLKLNQGVLIEICRQFLDGDFFIIIRNMAIDVCGRVYAGVTHKAARLQ